MNKRLTHIGFSQRIRLEWLAQTANLVLAGNDETSIYNALQDLLNDKLSVGSNARWNNREKAIIILMKIWVRPPYPLRHVHQAGLELLARLPSEYHIAIHWGMTMAVYPFWGAVAAHVGRLLRLQGKVRHAQVRRRIMEQYGQRSTVKDAVRRVLRSMVDWGVLRDALPGHTGRFDGTYVSGLSLEIARVELIAWLVEAFLHAHSENSVAFQTILNSPRLFPFCVHPVPAAHLVAASDRLDVLRHGLDQELLLLRTTGQA